MYPPKHSRKRITRRGVLSAGAGTPGLRVAPTVFFVATDQFSIETISPAYWRVTFSNGPVNLIDPDTIEELAALLDRATGDPELRVIVFRSDNPEFFMAHWDLLADRKRVAAM
jgi:hypothetical protein